jgi:hypothetical protein
MREKKALMSEMKGKRAGLSRGRSMKVWRSGVKTAEKE